MTDPTEIIKYTATNIPELDPKMLGKAAIVTAVHIAPPNIAAPPSWEENNQHGVRFGKRGFAIRTQVYSSLCSI